eukprot:CAMPEP_0185023780 /NCGR_PEP_ID=MMETSP1103-20130426/6407_1 /TAXON_ID=36769 /ORGANISM="Paraphysomonas bandaiensis, Strain Caron Lab Isolate" /LENGTH=349 /DNA_ID=CAMNT_0027556525 /DNA_START=129 /DNA_END=1175 /DNA_ORIENTATION=+
MTDLVERITAAKQQVEGLKKEVENAHADKMSTYAGISKQLKQPAPPLGPTPKVRRTLRGHFGKVYALHWSGDSTHLVSASQDGKLIVWNGMQQIKTQAIPLRSSWVMTCAFEQSKGNLVACGGLDNLCSIYQLNQPQVMRSHRELAAHDGYLSCCRFIDESQILTSSGDSTCMLWDIEAAVAKATFSDHDGDVMSVSVLPGVDDNIFVSGSCDSFAKVWDIRSNKCTMTFRGHESDINSVALFPDGKSFGTGSDDSSCRYFDMRSCAEVCEFRNDMVLCGITSVAFSRSGRILFAGYDDYNCLGWDVLGPVDKSAFQMQNHENRVSCIGVAPSGEALCTGSWDTVLKIW